MNDISASRAGWFSSREAQRIEYIDQSINVEWDAAMNEISGFDRHMTYVATILT